MKIKTYLNKEQQHKTPLACLDWSNNEEIYTVSDEHQIYKWNSLTRESVEIAKLPDDFIPTDLHWIIGKSGGNKSNGDSLLISSNDGRFVILNKSARVERNIAAHSMAITSGRWSPDGASLLTAGEDGIIKIWSRSGMLRSTVIQSDESIRCARWSSNSQLIVFCQNSHISVKPLAANSKLIKWRAHDGLVLCISWSHIHNLIASGGEDLRYKIWDQQGANIYTSQTDDYAISSIEFSPNQDLLAVGSFNLLKLCSSNGWSYSNARFNTPPLGSLYNIKWSTDGTQMSAGSPSGNLVFGHIIERQLISRNLKATTARKSILLKDLISGTIDVLDFPNRIINLELSYGHLIVATANQIHIFNENSINTPIIVDGRTDTRIIQLGKKFFLVVDSSSIWIYTYSGRLHLNPRYPGSQAQISSLTKKFVSIGLDVLAILDSADASTIYVFDLLPGASRQTEPTAINTKTQVLEVASCRSGTLENQYVVYIDSNRELYIFSAKNINEQILHKIGTQVMSVLWANEANILVGLHDNCYSVWYCPGEGSNDQTLIALTTVTLESSEFGKNVVLESFEGSIITFCSSGALFTVNVNIYCEILHRCLMERQWQKALNICRIAQNTMLWATLAAFATKQNQLEISEEAYSAAFQIDKVIYLQYIKSLPQGSPEQMAEKSLLLGHLVEAETILLHNKKLKQAIALCIRMHKWKRALEIAEKNQIDLDLVLNERKKYLLALRKEEFDVNFLKLINN